MDERAPKMEHLTLERASRGGGLLYWGPGKIC